MSYSNTEASLYYQWIIGAKDPLTLLLKNSISSPNSSSALYEPSAFHSWMDLMGGYPEDNWEPALLASDWGGVNTENGYVLTRGDREWAVIPIRRDDALLCMFVCDEPEEALTRAEEIQRMVLALYAFMEAKNPADMWRFAEASPERWIVCNREGIVWWNDTMCSWMGGLPVTDAVSWPNWIATDAVIKLPEFWATLEKNGSWSGQVSGDNPDRPMWWQVSYLEQDKFLVRVHTYDEVSANILSKSHWQSHDPVTGLPRQSVMSPHWRTDGAPDWGFAVWAIEDFHSLNQSAGMLAGDKVLEIAGATINRALPQGWNLWRGRAETFYGMGPVVVSNNDWYSQTLTIRTSLTDIPEIRCSIGLTSGSDYNTCMLAAQEALEYAQANHGQQAVWNSSDRQLQTPKAVAAAVAVMDPSISCNIVYLPIMSTSAPQRIQAFEALLRWHHPHWGVLTPDMFWHEAEKTGTVHKIGPWMINTLLKQIKAWQSMGHQVIEVHVNVSAVQIQNPEFTHFLKEATEQFDWNGAKLMLEIPEREIETALDAWRRYQPQWKQLGIGIVLDEWGAGTSANARLAELCVDRIKLSPTLIQSLHDERQRYILQGMVSWLHHCGYSVIADGVESTEHKHWASEIGCDAYQGYLNSKDRKVIRWKI